MGRKEGEMGKEEGEMGKEEGEMGKERWVNGPKGGGMRQKNECFNWLD